MTDEELKKQRMLGHRDRVRQTAAADEEYKTFSPRDMLEMFLFASVPRKDTKPIAQDLIDRFGSLYGVLTAPVVELMTVRNMTENAAWSLSQILPMARKARIDHYRNAEEITSYDKALKIFQAQLENRSCEMMAVACLDSRERLIDVSIVEVGSHSTVEVNVMKIVKSILYKNAARVLIAHNHPSGYLDPSEDDIKTSIRLILSLLTMDVILTDHVICCDEKYFSMYHSGFISAGYELYDYVYGTGFKDRINRDRLYKPFGSEYVLCDSEKGCLQVVPISDYNKKLEMSASRAKTLRTPREIVYEMVLSDVTGNPDLKRLQRQIRELGVKNFGLFR